jgi:hypothetical protein
MSITVDRRQNDMTARSVGLFGRWSAAQATP